ncbi:MAG: porphobilinogen synthase [Candidatus Omnitrophota bacterium]
MQVARLRRLRQRVNLRDWISQTRLDPKDVILPYFVTEGRNAKKEIKSMPGVYHFSIDSLLKDISGAKEIRSILLFGIPETKDKQGSPAYRDDGIVQKAVKAIKTEFRKLIVITDVCLCGYTTHGHCGIIRKSKVKSQKSKIIDNDETLKVLANIALSHAEAGVDFVAPSAMMDGQVRAIREMLDKNGFDDTGIMAYSAKYASSFYGPFREALDSRPQFGDRKSYQMDYRNSNEALREIKQDIDEGADIVMVKPALAYLDIIYRAKQKFAVPIAAYNVSGEYSMIKKLAGGDKAREKELALEVLASIKRAGADLIISYFGKEVLRWLA